MKAETTPIESMGDCLQWACSPRGGNNFYGRVLNGCSRREFPNMGTVGVTLTRLGHYLMLWDPEWFVQQEKAFQLLVIVHEAGHLVLQHLERAMRMHLIIQDVEKSIRLRPVINIAQDMAVNDISVRPLLASTEFKFATHKEKCIWPEDRDYPVGKTFEEYLALLLADLKEHGWDAKDPGEGQQPGQSGSGPPNPQPSDGESEGEGEGEGGGENPDPQQGQEQGQGDGDKLDDSYPQWFKNLLNKAPPSMRWEEVFDKMTDAEIERALTRARQEAKRITKHAVDQTQKCRGTVPAGMQSAIDDLLEDATIPWQEVLRGMLKSELSQKLDESTAYLNPSFLHLDDIEPYPGYQKNFTFRIAAGFDTSGSMSQDEFRDCCTELVGLMETEDGVVTRMIQFDAAIQHEEDLESVEAADLRRGVTRYGHGGTSFSPFLRYLLDIEEQGDWMDGAHREVQPFLHPDLVIIFTDGYAPIPLPELDPGVPLMWVITNGGKIDPSMNLVVEIDR